MWGDNKAGESQGGFMDDSYNTSAQASSKETSDAPVKSSNILPVMLGNLANLTPDTIKYRDTKIRIIRVVTVVKKISEATTKVAYDLEDETGKFTAYRWLEQDEKDTSDAVGIEVNKYAVIHGCLREGGEEAKHIFILKIRPVKKFAEVYNHLLEVATIALDTEMVPANSSSSSETSMAVDSSNDGIPGNMNNEQRCVFKLVKSMDAIDSGIERSEIKAKVPPAMVSKVDDILEFLVSEGHVYTTRTDDHFKAT